METNRKILENENIRLRKEDINDLEFLYSLENDINLWQISNTKAPFSKLDIRNHLEYSSYDIYTTKQLRLMIEDKISYKIYGIVDLFEYEPINSRAGIGIVVCREYRRNYVAKEAINIVINYCRDVLLLNQIWCNIDDYNYESIKLFESLNFKKSGILKKWSKSKNGFNDVFFYQLLL